MAPSQAALEAGNDLRQVEAALRSLPERTRHIFLLNRIHGRTYAEIAKVTGTGKLLVKVCPAHVYSENPDGTIAVEYAGCLECGTCKALSNGKVVKDWNYPQGTLGIEYRMG